MTVQFELRCPPPGRPRADLARARGRSHCVNQPPPGGYVVHIGRFLEQRAADFLEAEALLNQQRLGPRIVSRRQGKPLPAWAVSELGVVLEVSEAGWLRPTGSYLQGMRHAHEMALLLWALCHDGEAPPGTLLPVPLDDRDALTRRWTAFASFACLLAGGQQDGQPVTTSYWPSLYPGRRSTPVEVAEVRALADAYDATQAERGDPRRACRGCVNDWSPPCC